MSIYSGFATRQLQQTYDHCLNSLLYILQKRILKFYTNQKTDQYKFTNLVQKMYLQMKHMEKSKYLDPKCSYAVQQLFQYLSKENNSDRNATVQQNSQVDDNIKKQVYNKKPLQQKSFQSSQYNEIYNKQKTYQIPIRSQKQSPNKLYNKINKSSKIKQSSSTSKNIGKVNNSTSKQKPEAHTITIQHGKNLLRQRTPSTSHAIRLISQNKIVHHKQKQQLLYRNRNYSFNQGNGIIQSKKFEKSSARVPVEQQNSNSFSLKQQNQIHDIIRDYIQKTKRIPSATVGNSKVTTKQKSWVELHQNSRIQIPQDSGTIANDDRKIRKKSNHAKFGSISRDKNFVS